jgi:hypothetical protein
MSTVSGSSSDLSGGTAAPVSEEIVRHPKLFFEDDGITLRVNQISLVYTTVLTLKLSFPTTLVSRFFILGDSVSLIRLKTHCSACTSRSSREPAPCSVTCSRCPHPMVKALDKTGIASTIHCSSPRWPHSILNAYSAYCTLRQPEPLTPPYPMLIVLLGPSERSLSAPPRNGFPFCLWPSGIYSTTRLHLPSTTFASWTCRRSSASGYRGSSISNQNGEAMPPSNLSYVMIICHSQRRRRLDLTLLYVQASFTILIGGCLADTLVITDRFTPDSGLSGA